MATRNIRITGGNPTTQQLTLDYPRKEAHPGDKIHWHINTPIVYSIVRIEPKAGQTDIWVRPPAPQGNHFEGEIKSTPDDYYNYNYTIVWKATSNGVELKHDPIIAIKPTGVIIPPETFIPQNTLSLIIATVLMLTGITILIAWLVKRKRAKY